MPTRTHAIPYAPAEVEPKIYRRWERAGVFRPSVKPRRGRKSFVIVIPPPNITGSLHMGHALQDTLMDVLTRFHRMRGDDTLWVPGTDHAGIATQNIVERELAKEGTTRHALGREAFERRVWAWKERYGGIITEQLRRLGCSCDWSRERFTLDPPYIRAVQEAFIHYARNGLIYRGERIINWCPRCASAISDLEVEHREENATLYAIRYPSTGGGPGVTVTTVRPETMFGDVAVAVRPGDERYRALVGQRVQLPLTNRTLPVLADEAVDPAFGTGAVKVTPAHDFTDFEIGSRHELLPMKVINEDGRMNERAGRFAGLAIAEARATVVAALKEHSLLVNEEPYRHTLAACARCGTTVEPLISTQWFVTMAPLAAPAISVVEKNLIAFHPPRWKRAYLDWLRNVKDWCISRQLWWGHRLPVWYCQTGKRNSKLKTQNSKLDGHAVFSVAKPKSCSKCGGKEFVQDPDVLDTWFSSALWPFAVFGWPEATADLRRFYPTSVLTTAPEILYLWVARMVFSGLEFLDQKRYLPGRQYGKRTPAQRVPFRDVLIHPTVLTRVGTRMSKSKGTGVDPVSLIERYGADATRFGLLLQVHEDQQALRFDEQAIVAARNFMNKLWNVSRYLQQWKRGVRRTARGAQAGRTPHDVWILSRYADTVRDVTRALDAYAFGTAARLLHAFVWDDFADWYIEASKVPGHATFAVGRTVFLGTLRLLHPLAPFITEHLWGQWEERDLVAAAPWPAVPRTLPGRLQAVRKFHRLVGELRALRHLLGLPATAPLPTRVACPARFQALLERWANVRRDDGATDDQWVPVAGSGGAVQLPRSFLAGVPITKRLHAAEADVERFEREAARLQARIRGMEGKAPAEAVERQRGLLVERERALQDARRVKDVLAGLLVSSSTSS